MELYVRYKNTLGTFSIPVIRDRDQDNLYKKVFNLGAHDSRGLDSMTITARSVAAERKTWR